MYICSFSTDCFYFDVAEFRLKVGQIEFVQSEASHSVFNHSAHAQLVCFLADKEATIWNFESKLAEKSVLKWKKKELF